MRINVRKRELSLKIVYFGPGLSGKTTNLVALHRRLPARSRGELLQLDTETERTLFFDYFPMELGRVGPYTIKIDAFTVPGQSFYRETRRAVLEGVDGIVFVADADPRREEANVQARADMERMLTEHRRPLSEVPHVYQWNKADLPNATPARVLDKVLNPEGAPAHRGIATEGVGVAEVWDLILELVMEDISSQVAPGAAEAS